MKFTNVSMIDVSDWDDMVVKTYGKPYSFQQQDGCKERGIFNLRVPDNTYEFDNDTIPETVNHAVMGVRFNEWLVRDPKQELNAENWKSPSAITMWWERNFYPDVQMIANDLYDKGLLSAGDYVINIDW